MSPTKSSRRLQYKLLAPLLGTGLLLALVLHFYWLPARLASVRSDFQQVQKRMLAVLNPPLVGLLLSDDIVQVHRMLEQVAQDTPHWTVVTLIDAKGQRLYPIVAQAVAPDKRMVNMVSFDEALNYHGTTLGRLQVMADPTDAIQEETDQLLSAERWLLLLLAMTAGLIGWLQSRIVMRPLQQLAAAADRLAENDFSAELPHASQDEVGHLVRAFGAMRENRRLAETEVQRVHDLLRDSIDALDEAFVVYDPQDRLVLCNDKYREAYSEVAHLMVPGAQFEDIIRGGAELGQYVAAIGRVDEWVAERLAIHLAANTTVIQKHSNGRTLRIVERRLPDGHVVGFRIDISDLIRVTEELQSQGEELRQSNEELEEKNKLLADQRVEVEYKNREIEASKLTLEERAEQLALTSRYKSEFLSNMSHELRTPLNSLLILSQLLAENAERNMSGQQIEYAKIIHGAGKDLLALISDILDLSKIESGTVTPELEDVSLANVGEQVERAFRHVAESRGLGFGVELAPGLPPSLYTDSQRLQQVMKNLLSNAFKFTEKGQVSVRIEPVESGWSVDHDGLNRAQAVLGFFVTDSGIGLPTTKQKIIFEAFQQADTGTARKYGGTGLGLSISREIAWLLGGELRLAMSSPGQGSTFVLYLPLRAPEPGQGRTSFTLFTPDATQRTPAAQEGAADANPQPPAALDDRAAIKPGERTLLIVEDDAGFAGSLAGKKVLVVDDDVRNIFALTAVLERHKMAVLSAENGRAALEELGQNPDVDIVLMDIMMPEMDGFETMRQIRQMKQFESLPMIALTAKAMKGDREKCIEAGASDYVSKPVDTDQLVSLLRVWLYR